MAIHSHMHDSVRVILQELESIEPFPAVAIKVLEMSLQDSVIPNDMVDLIETDAGITAKVLSRTNSAYYGLRRKISTIREAVNHLGVIEIVEVVMSSAAKGFFTGYGHATSQSHQSLWEQSIGTAIGCRLIARLDGEVDPHRAYTIGLLQNIGHVVLDRFLTHRRDQILEDVNNGKNLLEAERDHLGLDHAELGARMARRWNFPPILINTILNHHSPESGVLDPRLCSVCDLGEAIAAKVITKGGAEIMAYGVSATTLEIMEMAEQGVEALEECLTAEMAANREALDL